MLLDGLTTAFSVNTLRSRSRVAFKLVWCPPAFTSFVLVDDDGTLLNKGRPSGSLPPLRERQRNFEEVKGSKYSVAAVTAGQE